MIRNTILLLLTMLAMVALFCEGDNLVALLGVKAAGFGLFAIIIKLANHSVAKQ